MLFNFVVLNILAIAYALPYGYNPKNVVTVPPNCREDQDWHNGACRDDWYTRYVATSLIPEGKLSNIPYFNFLSVPRNCPPGQSYSNGQCRRDYLANSLLFNQQLENLWNDYVRKVQQARVEVEEYSNLFANNAPRGIITVPNQCPIGYKADALGICRPRI